MNKYTKQQNVIRKSVADYMRKHSYRLTKTEVFRKFGKSKVVIKAYEDMASRIYDICEYSESANFEKFIKSRLEDIAYYLPSSGYSMGDFKTAYIISGGKTYKATYDYTSTYANSCRWRGSEKHGDISCQIPARYLRAKVIGGLPTLFTGRKRGNIQPCTWLEFKSVGKYASAVVEVKEVKGWLVRYPIRGSRYRRMPFHTTTYASSKRKAKEYDSFAKEEKEWSKKHRLAEKYHKIATSKNEIYTFADSLAAGNCEPGTLAFCRANGIDRNSSMTGKQLVEYAENERYTTYINRIINKRAEMLASK